MAKFRCGVAPIRVETGRYENIPFHERLCEHCNVVETEAHCLLECYLYNDIRRELLEKAREVFSDFDNFVMSEKLSVILSNIMSVLNIVSLGVPRFRSNSLPRVFYPG